MIWRLVLIFLFPPLTSAHMVITEHRRFWDKFSNKADFRSYLQSANYSMAYATVIQERLDLVLVFREDRMLLMDAVKDLLRVDTHTIIFCFRSALTLQRAFYRFRQNKETTQLWSYYPIVEGPAGSSIVKREVRQVLNLDFIDNRILAVGWSSPIKRQSHLKYNKSHISEMSDRLEQRTPNSLFVLVFDAIILSNSPEVVEWIPTHMMNMPVLIRLLDYEMQEQLDLKILTVFVRNTKMIHYFFDLPWEIHTRVIEGDDRFTTSTPVEDKGVSTIPRNIKKVAKYFWLLRLVQLWRE